MIENNGKVAIKYFQTIPHKVKVNGRVYLFAVKMNICMSWIEKEDVDEILKKVKSCCGGKKNNVYRYANALDVVRWTGEVER
jgi:hypothetical protein